MEPTLKAVPRAATDYVRQLKIEQPTDRNIHPLRVYTLYVLLAAKDTWLIGCWLAMEASLESSIILPFYCCLKIRKNLKEIVFC